MKVRPPIFILILILTLISTWNMNVAVVHPNVDLRIEHEDKILAGQNILASSFPSRSMRYIIVYTLLDYVTFFSIFYAFFVLLKRSSLPDTSALLGLALLQVVIPLSITGYDVNGDFITLFFYLLSSF